MNGAKAAALSSLKNKMQSYKDELEGVRDELEQKCKECDSLKEERHQVENYNK